MAVTLLGYLENLILYQFGAYACFDLKTRMPWIQIAGAGMCALLFMCPMCRRRLRPTA